MLTGRVSLAALTPYPCQSCRVAGRRPARDLPPAAGAFSSAGPISAARPRVNNREQGRTTLPPGGEAVAGLVRDRTGRPPLFHAADLRRGTPSINGVP